MPSPEQFTASLREMSSDELHRLAEAVRRMQIERAVDRGDHAVEHVVSFEVRGGDLVEVGGRDVVARNMR